ncbi:MAG: sulfite exporter TauE/SafE family protein [Alphaproteobacteria bacterium]|uniref:Probable membrane transporter protein n=1 Tax=Candidatus Nitrobium versatile TaxID=2884831 RepID=A0A953J8M7_9BACT|nr:sulfite exporter TauE/SafE family protein [Candidatus Nitrobium versatile]
MYLYLPVALTSINILIPVGLGLAVGLLSGLFGVGGGFLMTPLLIMFGIPSTVAAATDSNQIVAASTSGTYAHWKVGNVDFKMGLYLLAGGFVGGLIGVQGIKILNTTGNADFVIKMTYVLMLGIVGIYMFIESLRSMRQKGEDTEESEGDSGLARFLRALPLQTRFEKSGVTHSVLVPLFFGGFVGILAAVMGVGGGFLMVPVMVYILRMPMHVVVGTSLFQILFNCIEVTFLQAYTNHNVDFILAVLLLIGSTFGAQIGAVFGRKLKGEQLKIILACIVLAVTVKIILELTMTPSLLLGQSGGH